jgi:hypothetical protein
MGRFRGPLSVGSFADWRIAREHLPFATIFFLECCPVSVGAGLHEFQRVLDLNCKCLRGPCFSEFPASEGVPGTRILSVHVQGVPVPVIPHSRAG